MIRNVLCVRSVLCVLLALTALAAWTGSVDAQSRAPGWYVATTRAGSFGPYENQTKANDAARYLRSLGFVVTRVWFEGNANIPTGKPLSEYVKEVRDAYQRAVDLRNWAQGHIGRLTQQQFNTVNQAINQYNTALSNAQNSPYRSQFGGYSRMANIPGSWVQTSQTFAIYYRSRSGGEWRFLTTVNGTSARDQALTYYRRNYPSYEFGWVAR